MTTITNAINSGSKASSSLTSASPSITPAIPTRHREDTPENDAKRDHATLLNLVYERSTTKMLVLSLQRRHGFDSTVTHVDANVDHCAIQVTIESFVTEGLFETFIADYPTTRIEETTDYCYQIPEQVPKTSFSFWIFPCAQISSLAVHIRRSVFPAGSVDKAIRADRIEFDYVLAKDEWDSGEGGF
jgi:hypothetical protein